MVLEGSANATAPQNIFPTVTKSEPMFRNQGFFLPIAWPLEYNTGWWFDGPNDVHARQLITRSDPEFFALNNTVRANNSLATINVNEPRYMFDRDDYTYDINNIQKTVEQQQQDKEDEFKRFM